VLSSLFRDENTWNIWNIFSKYSCDIPGSLSATLNFQSTKDGSSSIKPFSPIYLLSQQSEFFFTLQ